MNHGVSPDLLILAGVSRKITVESLELWEKHSPGKPKPKFTSVARMSFIGMPRREKNHQRRT
ncbi:MAG: hypothetical protein PF503_18565 [Desulfobacula sp.]|jgi:hypothetical protein|nr:hypothetical protein [Desulfobacula sp.]